MFKSRFASVLSVASAFFASVFATGSHVATGATSKVKTGVSSVFGFLFGRPPKGAGLRWYAGRVLFELAVPLVGVSLVTGAVLIPSAFLVPLVAFTAFNAVRGGYIFRRGARGVGKLVASLLQPYTTSSTPSPLANLDPAYVETLKAIYGEAGRIERNLVAGVERARPERNLSTLPKLTSFPW